MNAARWDDLRARVLSAVVMVAVGGLALWLGGLVFAALVIGVAGLMVWEFYAMAVPDAPPARAEAHGVAAAVLVAVFSFTWGGWVSAVGLAAAAALIAQRLPRDRARLGAYLALILIACHALIALREAGGLVVVLWLVAVVVASDIAGYFAGRVIGGPKFWPSVSPKKTWSGTVAGWLLAAAVGAGFAPLLGGGAGLIALSVVLAFAGQLGDIAESALKRRAGVKDSSRLIPGHGGVLDRFDALIAVAALAWVLALFGLLQAAAGGGA
jgi:phosphatidate cytidylyltransferase